MPSKSKQVIFENLAIISLAVFAGFMISFYNLSILILLASTLFVAVSFKYFNKILLLLILYVPFQIALNISPGIDLASGRVLILFLFTVWIFKSLAEKKFTIRLNLQTLLILLFLFIAGFSMLEAWDGERAIRKMLVFLSIFPLYFIITSLPLFSNSAGTKQCPVSATSWNTKPINELVVADKNKYIHKILITLFISGFILSLIGIFQFLLQFFIGIDSVMLFWSEYIAPVFYGNTFGAQVISNPSWLVNIGGATVLRAISLFPDPHMFSFYLGLLIPIALAIVLCGKGDTKNQTVQELKKPIKLSFPSRNNIQDKLRRESSKQAIYFANWIPVFTGMTVLGQSDRGAGFQSNKLLYFVLFAMLLAEFLTFSRGGYLGMIFGIGAVVVFGWRYVSFFKKIVLGLVAGTAIIFLLTANQSIVNRFLSSFDFSEGSNSERMKNWSQGWEMFDDNFLLGVGIGNYSYELKSMADYRTPIYAHNLYLDIGAEMGIFALIAWLALIFITIYQLFKLSRSDGDNFTRSISLGLIGSLVWFSIHSFFDTSVYSPTILAMFVIVLSLSVLVLNGSEPKSSDNYLANTHS